MQSAAQRIMSDKARIARILNGLKHDQFLYPSCKFVCERIFNVDVVHAEKIEAKGLICDNPHVFYQT